MTPEQFKRAADLFLRASKAPPSERAALLDRECGSERVVHREVERMLKFDSDDSLDSAGIRLSERGSGDSSDHELYPTGTQIGDYTVVRTLGEGGMGRVLEVEQQHPRRHVALKLLRQDVLSGAMLRRFDHEVRILGGMRHEGIARIHAAGWTETKPPQPFFTMELIDGEPITSYARHQRLTIQQRLDLVAAVCDAIHYTHQRGVVHRDLKPGNILVGNDGKPKVIDFGIARIAESDVSANTLRTATGQVLGTLSYMSPEQVAGDPARIDSRTDVYSMGVILFELLSGKLPHDLTSCSLPEAARLVQQSDIPRLGSIERTFRGDIETIVDKAVEKDPARRYQSMSELAADIRRFLSHQPIVARPASAIYQLKKFARRHTAATAACLVILLALAGATVVSSVYAVRSERAREATQRQADIAAAINRFLNDDLLASVVPSASRDAGRGRDVHMIEVLDEAARRIESACQPGGDFEDKPEVEAEIRSTLGKTYSKLGDFAAAYPHAKRCFALREQLWGQGHIETIRAAITLGNVLYLQNDLEEASAVFERTLQVGRLALGPDHHKILDCEYNYANVFYRQRRIEEGLALLNHVLEVRRRELGADHNATMATLRKIALLYKRQGRWKDAEPIEREVLAHSRVALGDDHPDTLRVAHNLGSSLYYAQRHDEAEKIWRDVLEKRRRVLGEDHYETLSTYLNLGSTLVEQGRPAEAEPFYRAGYDAALAKYGMKEPKTLTLAYALANALRDQKRFDDAESLYRTAISQLRETLGPDHPRALDALKALADMRQKQGRAEEAEAMLAGPVDALVQAGTLAENTSIVEALIRCRVEIGLNDEAIELARAYAAALAKKHGLESPEAERVHKLLQRMEQRATSKPAG